MRAVLVVGLLAFLTTGSTFLLSRGRAPAEAATGGAPGSALAMVRDSVASTLVDPEQPPTRPASAGATSANTYYQWVDEAGDVHFVARLDEVPAQWRDRAGRVELGTRPVNRVAARAPSMGRLAALAAPDPDVVVYTAPWCGWCRKTIAYLDRNDISYTNKDVDANPGYKRELIEKSGGGSIPVVEIDGQLIRGYSPGKMDQLLDL